MGSAAAGLVLPALPSDLLQAYPCVLLRQLSKAAAPIPVSPVSPVLQASSISVSSHGGDLAGAASTESSSKQTAAAGPAAAILSEVRAGFYGRTTWV